MFKQQRTRLNKTAPIFVLILATFIIIISTVFASSFFAILGVAFLFWGAILVYVMPTKQIPITMFYAATEGTMNNIERIINEFGTSLAGIYLPPGNLKNPDSSIVVIPKKPKITLPSPSELTDRINTNKKNAVTITPPGASLCRLFERELNVSFAKLNLNQLEVKLPKLLVERMELAEKIEIKVQRNRIILEISRSILDEICQQTDFQPKTHKQVGCLLSSAIACALAKVSGKPVTIQNENRNQKTKTTHIEYQLLEG